MPRRELRHGSRSCYVAGCQRAECVAANTSYLAAWRAARLAAGWTVRRGRWTPPPPRSGSNAR